MPRAAARPAGALRLGLIALLGAGFMLLMGCGEQPPAHQFTGQAFGTAWSATLSERTETPEELEQALVNALAEIDQTLSTWRDDSEISAFNQQRSEDWFDLAPAFAEVLDGAQWAARETGGALDITLRTLSLAWGFQGDGEPTVPSPATINAIRERTGMHLIERSADGSALRKRNPEVEIDLSAVAKGYAVDRLAAVLRAHGMEDFLVDIGGEIYAAGERPGGGPWRIAIEALSDDTGAALALSDQAVATSGDYRIQFEVEGQRYAHVLHPLTGRPPSHGTAMATVIAEEAMTADALATAMLVLRPADALAAADRLGVGLRLVIRTTAAPAGSLSTDARETLEVRMNQRFTAHQGEATP